MVTVKVEPPCQNTKAVYELYCGKAKGWETVDVMVNLEQADVPNPGKLAKNSYTFHTNRTFATI